MTINDSTNFDFQEFADFIIFRTISGTILMDSHSKFKNPDHWNICRGHTRLQRAEKAEAMMPLDLILISKIKFAK